MTALRSVSLFVGIVGSILVGAGVGVAVALAWAVMP